MTIASLYPYLILIGLSIILATSWLLFQARGRAELTNELVQLNQSLQFDLPDFLRSCWKPLKKAGYRGISWNLEWFGSSLTFEQGKTGESKIERVFEVQDIKLSITLHDGHRRFEQRYFSKLLSESFFLLLYTDMWVKLGTVQGAFAQSAKMNVFLQHDMKNIVQLVSLMAEQLESTPADQEPKMIQGLRTVMPTLRDRSERFLVSLSDEPPKEDIKKVELSAALLRTAEIHDLKVEIEGFAATMVNERSIDSIFDNIFGNYVDQLQRVPGQETDLRATIEQVGNVIKVSIQDNRGKPCEWPERLFEPFWSEKGNGLGIGLYHARQLMLAAGGELEALAPEDQPLQFVVTIPTSV